MKNIVIYLVFLHGVYQILGACPVGCRCTYLGSELYDSLECTNMSLTEIPMGNMDVILGKLDLSFNKLTVLKSDSFINREIVYMDKLLLNNNEITDIDSNAFRGVVHLTHLNLQHNNITTLQNGVFEHLEKLNVLKMSNNHKLQLPAVGFSLPLLRILDLAQCNLRDIPRDFFQYMKILDIIDLHGNELTTLDANLIKPLQQLEYLDLRRNKFVQLKTELLQLPHSLDIELAGNPFHCDCELQEAYALYKKRVHNFPLFCSTPKTMELLEPYHT